MPSARTFLSQDLIERCGSRAAGYDRDNKFFQEDWDELKEAGFLTINVPEDLGGKGFSMGDTCRELRRLAERAPATALATNMHLYWTGIAAEMRRLGDPSAEWMLRDAPGLARHVRQREAKSAQLTRHGHL